MKKIVSNILIVSTQLLVGGLFLLTLFSNNESDNSVVIVRNNNLDKMADSVSDLFIEDLTLIEESENDTIEEELVTEAENEAIIIQQEAEEKAKLEAEEQARAQEEEQKRQEEEKKAQEEAARNAVVENASGYISKPGAGFEVTTNNNTYTLSDDEFVAVSAVVNCEGTSKDDMLAVASVILNRADARGQTPLQVVSAAGQFTCYTMYTKGSASSSGASDQVLTDALNGIRNNNYHSFNGMNSGVSDNYIVSNGNRFY